MSILVALLSKKQIPSYVDKLLESNGISFKLFTNTNEVNFETYQTLIINTESDKGFAADVRSKLVPTEVNSFYFNFELLSCEDDSKTKSEFIAKVYGSNSVNFKKWDFFAETYLPTEYGDFVMFGFKSRTNGVNVLGLRTKVLPKIPVVRTHSMCYTGDIFHSLNCDCREELENALRLIQREGGMLIYPEEEGRGIGVLNKIKIYELQNNGADTVEAQHLADFPNDLRTFDYLKDVFDHYAITKIKLITNNPQKKNLFLKLV